MRAPTSHKIGRQIPWSSRSRSLSPSPRYVSRVTYCVYLTPLKCKQKISSCPLALHLFLLPFTPPTRTHTRLWSGAKIQRPARKTKTKRIQCAVFSRSPRSPILANKARVPSPMKGRVYPSPPVPPPCSGASHALRLSRFELEISKPLPHDRGARVNTPPRRVQCAVSTERSKPTYVPTMRKNNLFAAGVASRQPELERAAQPPAQPPPA